MHEQIEITKNEKDMSTTISTTTIDNNGPLQMRQQYRQQQEQQVFNHKQLQFQQQHMH